LLSHQQSLAYLVAHWGGPWCEPIHFDNTTH
jgi:hypothetical protein